MSDLTRLSSSLLMVMGFNNAGADGDDDREIDENHSPEFRSWKDRAIKLYEEQNYPGSLEAFDKAIELTNSNVVRGKLYARKCEIHILTDNFTDLLECSTKVIEYCPDDSYGYFTRSRAWEEFEEYIKACEDLWEAAQIIGEIKIPIKMEQLFMLAGAKSAKELVKYREIVPMPSGLIESYFRTLIEDPIVDWINGKFPQVEGEDNGSGDSPPSGFVGALHALHNKNYATIIDLCTQEIENPTTKWAVEAHYLRGTFRYFWSYTDGVSDDLEYIISSPDAAIKFKIYALIRMGEFNELLQEEGYKEWFDEAAKLDENNVDIIFLRADYLADNRKHSEAIKELDKVLEIKPDHAVAWAVKYFLEIRLAQDAEEYELLFKSVDLLETVVRENGQGNPDLFLLYGQVLKELNDLCSAYVYIDRAGKLLPVNPVVVTSKAVIMHEMTGDHDACLRTLYEFIDSGLSDVGIYEAIAEIETIKGEFDKALEAVENGLKHAFTRRDYNGLCTFKHSIDFKKKANIVDVDDNIRGLMNQLGSLDLLNLQ